MTIGIGPQYTTNFKRAAANIGQKAQYTGNNVKSMLLSVEASLKKLRTNYIDILYVHWVSLLSCHTVIQVTWTNPDARCDSGTGRQALRKS